MDNKASDSVNGKNEYVRAKPRDYNAERSVIGSMLLSPEAIPIAAEKLKAEDFYDITHQCIFRAIVEVYNNRKTPDLVNILAHLKDNGVPEKTCSLSTLANLVRSVPTWANISEHCDIVAEKSFKRSLISVSEEIEKECYQDQSGLDTLTEETERKVYEVLRQVRGSDIKPIDVIVNSVLDDIEAAAKSKGYVTGISSGFYDLDYKTCGFQKSDLILLAARPSMGKTALALNIAEHTAVKMRVPTAIFSLEMSEKQIVNRFLSMNSKVDSQLIRTGTLNDSNWGDLMRSADAIADAPLFIDDTGSIKIKDLRAKCRKLKLDHDIGLVIIDYLQLMDGSSGKRNESKNEEVGNISKALKALAREIECPVIALSQLARGPEKRDDKRPMLSDLRDSGSIEQDADVVLFIYRDEYYHPEHIEAKNKAELIIAKQRNGPIGKVELGCQLELTRFYNLRKEKDNRF